MHTSTYQNVSLPSQLVKPILKQLTISRKEKMPVRNKSPTLALLSKKKEELYIIKYGG